MKARHARKVQAQMGDAATEAVGLAVRDIVRIARYMDKEELDHEPSLYTFELHDAIGYLDHALERVPVDARRHLGLDAPQ